MRSEGTAGMLTSTVAQEVLSLVKCHVREPTLLFLQSLTEVVSVMPASVSVLKHSTAAFRLFRDTTRTDSSPLSGLPMVGLKVLPS